MSNQTDKALASAKLAEKAVEVIRSLQANGYDPTEVFALGMDIIRHRAERSPAVRGQS